MKIQDALKQWGLYEYAKKYSRFVNLFNYHIEPISYSDLEIRFKYRGTIYKCETKFYDRFNQYCSVVSKVKFNGMFLQCKCKTKTDEKTYPVIAGYIATCLTDKVNNLLRKE